MADISRLLEDARSYHLSGDVSASRDAFLSVLQSDPRNVTALHHLGIIAFKSGQESDAINYLKSAASAGADRDDVMADMGVIFRYLGDLSQAETFLEKACLLAPKSASHLYNFGLVLGDLNKLSESEAAYRMALRHDPCHVGAHNNLGNVLKRQARYGEAYQAYREALIVDPDYTPALKNIADALEQSGEVEKAGKAYASATRIRSDGATLIRDALLLPVIPESRAQIEDYRARMEGKLEQLKEQSLRIDDPVYEVGATNFMLAYHGMNDRSLQTKVADLYRRVAPSLTFGAPHCRDWLAGTEGGSLRVGFVSSFFIEHTVGRLMEGVITGVSGRQAEVIVYTAASTSDQLTARLGRSASKVVQLPRRLEAAQQMIADDELDILYFCDIGMEPFTYFLSFARLAPIQCAGWGHPVTTGISTIDYFVSSRMMEPTSADDDYSENLVQIDGIPTPIRNPADYMTTPHRKEEKILCPQSLFKFHPDFDNLIGSILRACPRAQLLLLQGSRPEWTGLLEGRFRKTIPDVIDRIGYLPRMRRQDFLSTLAAAPLVLDTPHYSGGLTTQEALAFGTPVVTLPGKFLRGRVTTGAYRKMGFMACVADSSEAYEDIAIELIQNSEYARDVRAGILETVPALFDVSGSVREHLEFFERASLGEN